MGSTAQVEKYKIVLFDGICNLCNSSVNFIMDRDPARRFRFASLQSEEAQALLQRVGGSDGELSSIVLVSNGKTYDKSDAVLRIVKELRGLWPLLAVFWILPKAMRDVLYTWVATNRYRWFGVRDQCRMPDEETQDRFLRSSDVA